MNIKQTLQWAEQELTKTSASASLDAEVLLSYVLAKPKTHLFAQPEESLSYWQRKKIKRLIKQRKKEVPVAYLIRRKDFFGLDFYVDRNVLIPRPETELLVEKAINLGRCKKELLITDIGSGSGAIAISLAKNLPGAQLLAVDISNSVLRIAKKNAKHHQVRDRLKFYKGDLTTPFIRKLENWEADIMVTANLPYLTTEQWQETSVEIKFEPRPALDGGADGLDYYRQLVDQLAKIAKRFTLLMEIDPAQTEAVREIVAAQWLAADVDIKKDLAGRDRLVIVMT